MSVVPVIRRERPKPKVGSGAGVLAGQFDREALSTLLAPPTQDRAPPLRFHARAKTVCPNPALVAGTVRWLAHSCSNRDKREWGGRLERSATQPRVASLIGKSLRAVNLSRAIT
jgi:hypothetical protein